MAKIYVDTVKYLVYATIEIGGLVEKPDIVGAIFGQTEGLLGDELDLRELQKNGRIGRIEIERESTNKGATSAIVKIPSSLDMVETSIIAAALETVDRVGPCEARIIVERIEDTRNLKRKRVLERAKELLKTLVNTQIPESKELSESVRDEVKRSEITSYGPDALPAGPGIAASNELIIVEGRADVLNLLRNDITNVVAVQGARAPKSVVDLSKKKEATVFLDGDRGGDIILKELLDAGAEIDFVARAPRGQEVEELTRKEIIKCLRNRIALEPGAKAPERSDRAENERESRVESMPAQLPQFRRSVSATSTAPIFGPTPQAQQSRVVYGQEAIRVPPLTASTVVSHTSIASKPLPSIQKKVKQQRDFAKELDELNNTLKARLYDENMDLVEEIKVREVIKALEEKNGIHAIVFDGIITQRLVDLANSKGVRTIVGVKVGNVNKTPEGIKIVTKENK